MVSNSALVSFSGPIVTARMLRPICVLKGGEKLPHEFVLLGLRDHDMNQFQARSGFRLENSSGKLCVARKAEIVIRRCQLIESAVVDPGQLERLYRVNFVTIGCQGGQQLARHVLVKQNLHAAVASFSCASSRNAPCTAFSLNVG